MNPEIQVTKVGDNQIQVSTPTVTVNTFTYEYLVSQVAAIQAQKAQNDINSANALAYVQSLITQAEQLGVKPLPVPVDTEVQGVETVQDQINV